MCARTAVISVDLLERKYIYIYSQNKQIRNKGRKQGILIKQFSALFCLLRQSKQNWNSSEVNVKRCTKNKVFH